MKKLLIAIASLASLLSSHALQAQDMDHDYRTALGVKVWGDGGGISIKHFVRTNRALEGIGYFWRGGVRITGLYEYHFDFKGAPGLKWYVGPGAHVGIYNNNYDNNNGNGNGYYYGSGTYIGIDGVLGLDYKFHGAPINLSLDWQPSFEFGSNRGFAGSWGGLGIRYTF
jgi:hypothetical protein